MRMVVALSAIMAMMVVCLGLWFFAASRLDYCSFERVGKDKVGVVLHHWSWNSLYEASSYAEALDYASRLCPNFKEMPR